MNTIAIPRAKSLEGKIVEKVSVLAHYNKASLISGLLSLLFISYFLVPRSSFLSPLFSMDVLFIVLLPATAFLLSLMSIRQISSTHEQGRFISYSALTITSFYLIVSLAIPFVLFGLYLIYSYII